MIPKAGDPDWTVTQTDSFRNAPDGYEGRTDSFTVTAVGKVPATMGKRIVTRFELGNEIKRCPNADGTAEGEGVFSLSIDSTDMQPTGTRRQHVEMRTIGKYKGEVGDDAWIKNPVKGEIDFTYKFTDSGATTLPAGSDVSQHLTFPFSVGGAMMAPDIGPFSGGDPTAGHYATAYGAGTALVYWAGVYYSIAQTKWRQPRMCVEMTFTPASYTVQVVPGGKSTVEAQVKTKAGESVPAQFENARGYSDGAVSPSEGRSDAASPMKFTFLAPTKKVAKTGFAVDATSRAGIASGAWWAGLGTNWTGSITLSTTNTGDQGGSELSSWNNSSVTRIAIDLDDAKGEAWGYTAVHYSGVRRVRALRGGSVTLIEDSSDKTDGEFADAVPATVDVVTIRPGIYSVRVSYAFKKQGTAHAQTCSRNQGCRDSDVQLVIGSPMPAIEGQFDDPNHVRGSKTTVGKGSGYRGTGTITTTVTWDLARKGVGQ